MLTAFVAVLALAQAAPYGTPPQGTPRNPPPMKRIDRHIPGPTRNAEPRQKFEDDPANPTPDAQGAPAQPAATPSDAAPADPAAAVPAAAAPSVPTTAPANDTPADAPAGGALPAGAMTPRALPVPVPAAAAAPAPTGGGGSPIAQVFLLVMLAPMTLAAAWAVSRGTGTPG
jgi:hypothetical protein